MSQGKVLIGGDSFTFGSELEDQNNVWWKHIWPDAVSVARPGASNQQIARKIIENIDNASKVVVMWTFPWRYEFAFNIPTGHPDEPWLTTGTLLDTPEVTGFSDTFNKYVGTHHGYQQYTSWKEILLIQTLCVQEEIPYIFLSADWSIFEGESELRRYINFDNWYNPSEGCDGVMRYEDLSNDIPPFGFLNWATDKGYEKAPDQHPLDQAHIDFAGGMKQWLSSKE